MLSIAQKELQIFPPIHYLTCFMQGWLVLLYAINQKPLKFQLWEGLRKCITNTIFFSFWESADVISFILRQVTISDNQHPSSAADTTHLHTVVPNQAREKWIKKRTSVKIRNGAANHRGNDVIVLEGRDQVRDERIAMRIHYTYNSKDSPWTIQLWTIRHVSSQWGEGRYLPRKLKP